MNTLRERTPAPAALAPRHARLGIRVVALASGLQRVVLADGAVLGYLERVELPGAGPRVVSKRPRAPGAPLSPVGDFASADEAIDGLRFG